MRQPLTSVRFYFEALREFWTSRILKILFFTIANILIICYCGIMRKIVFITFFLLIAGVVFGQEFTFRGFPWGTTVDEIIAKEGQPDSNTHGQLIYQNMNVAGYNVLLFFYCSNTDYRLQTGRYVLGVSNENAQVVYNDLLGKLSALYGTPTSETKPLVDRYSFWLFSRTLISLTMIFDIRDTISKGATLINIDYYSPQSQLNQFGDL